MKTEPATPHLPRAKIKTPQRPSIIWIVPVIAAIASAWLVIESVRQSGPLITIYFNNGSGIQANQTVLMYRGVRLGEVRSVGLTPDGQRVEVKARLAASAKNLAREGSVFWVVRPEIGATGLHGLETVVSGPYIQIQPATDRGNSREQKTFIGAEQPPILDAPHGGLEVTLTTPHLPTLSVGSPVYYRGVEVGSVRYFVLADDATTVKIHLLIETNFAPLVRTDSMFWNAGGVKADLRFFKLDFNAQTFKSMVIGGIAFATPSPPGPEANANSTFTLFEKEDAKWLEWSPSIPISPKNENPADVPQSALMEDINQAQK
ncbi:MAG TPA: MlaD family protein [Candidatus Sulfotelmatobacter sp.]|nr:MlaD family protein [Candidatus Sulfotelmatobacter sp.]